VFVTNKACCCSVIRLVDKMAGHLKLLGDLTTIIAGLEHVKLGEGKHSTDVRHLLVQIYCYYGGIGGVVTLSQGDGCI